MTQEDEDEQGPADVPEAVEYIVQRAFTFDGYTRAALSAEDILKRWDWFGVPMPPTPSLEEVKAGMVIAAARPDTVVEWSRLGREFRNPKDGATGGEPRLRAIPVWSRG